jgi:rubrerythrin
VRGDSLADLKLLSCDSARPAVRFELASCGRIGFALRKKRSKKRYFRGAKGDHAVGPKQPREKPVTLEHPKLVKQLRLAYSAEKAAAFAYIGHAGSVKDAEQKLAIRQIELDEWSHRENVLAIMQRHGIPISRYNEIKFHIIGRVISLSCYFIGWFMPYYFAGRLESGNVCEYFLMMRYFKELGIAEHNEMLYEMGIKEKEHEVYFQQALEGNRLLPLFERIFGWGKDRSYNDVDLDSKYSVNASTEYCKDRK